MDAEKKAFFALIAASLIWSVAGTSYKFFYEAGIAVNILILGMLVFRFVSIWLIADYKKVKHEIVKDRRELKFVLLNGLFSLCTPFFFVTAVIQTSVSSAYFLVYTAPAWVMVFALIFLGEKLNTKKFVGILLTLLGVYIVADPIEGIGGGVVFALLAALTYAGDIVTGRELKDYSFHTVALYVTAIQIVLLSILSIFVFGVSFENFTLFIVAMIAVIGLLRGFASDFYYYSLETLEASTAAIISLSELIFASVIAFFVFGEAHTLREVIGYSFIFLAGLIILLRKSDLEDFEYLLHLKRKH